MVNTLSLLLVRTALSSASTAPPDSERHRALDSPSSDGSVIQGGKATAAESACGKSLAFDGCSVLEVRDSADLTEGDTGFTFTAWVNPYVLNGEQQMIAAKNRYSLNERQWGVMVDKDRRFRLYVWQGNMEYGGGSHAVQPRTLASD